MNFKQTKKTLKNKVRGLRKKGRQLVQDTPPAETERVTSTTLEKHKQEVFERAKPYVKPLTPNKRKMLLTTAGILAGATLAFVVLFGVLIYYAKSDSAMVYRVSRIIPYPAARINGSFVLYRHYLVELKPLVNFYQSPLNTGADGAAVDFSTPEGQQQLQNLRDTALNEAMRKQVIKRMAREHDVSVGREELNEEVERYIVQAGDERQFAEVIDQYYGWTVGEFRQAIRLQMLGVKLLPIISEEAREEAEAIRQEALEGADFAALAEEHSQDPGSREDGGDLGFAPQGTYVPEFEEVAFALEEDAVSELVATEFGFHIIKGLGQRDGEVRVAHILIAYRDLNEAIQEYLAEARVKNYVDFSIGHGEEE